MSECGSGSGSGCASARAPYLQGGCRDMFSEFLELLLEICALFQLNVLFVSHLNQQGFDPREACHDGEWNSVTSGRLGHLGSILLALDLDASINRFGQRSRGASSPGDVTGTA